jgi:hypothetical protein
MHGGPAGVFQRVVIIAYFTWMSILALHLNRVESPRGAPARSAIGAIHHDQLNRYARCLKPRSQLLRLRRRHDEIVGAMHN